MSLFVCSKCSSIENTALVASYWSGNELCSFCDRGNWHNRFDREKFDPEKWEYYDGKFVQRKSIQPK